jgi:hypothetical protein
MEGCMMETLNAKIEHVSLGFDHGIFTFNLHCEYSGGSGQGCGSIALSEHDRRRPVGTEILAEILSTVGINYWEELPGTRIRVRREREMIIAVGHYMDDRWINFVEFCKPYNEEKGLD